MNNIKILDKKVSSKLAAGEVIESPISIIKELVENSIDAGSTEIVVEIKKGGKQYIRVTDNGHGINEDDLDIVCLRHSTSKIISEEDLFNINTLGFRGEALASISAVSKVTIITKTDSSDTGIKAIYRNNTLYNKSYVTSNTGTSIICEDLFYNIPVRKNFLSSDNIETKKINDLIYSLSLSHPDISIKYISNNIEKINTFGVNNRLDRIRIILGNDIANNLIPITLYENEYKISGYISSTNVTRNSTKNQFFFVNNRYVKNKVLSNAVNNRYSQILPRGIYPICIVYLEVPFNKVDVNVHPAKLEVKYHDEKYIYNLLYRAVNETLNTYDISKTIYSDEIKIKNNSEKILSDNNNLTSNEKVEKNNNIYVPNSNNNSDEHLNIKEKNNINTRKDINDFDKQNKAIMEFYQDTLKDKELILKDSKSSLIKNEFMSEKIDFNSLVPKNDINDIKEKNDLKDLKYIGEYEKNYLLCQHKDTLVIIDKHALHERIIYESFLKSLSENEFLTQHLAIPITIDISRKEIEYVQDNINNFYHLGLEVDIFGTNTAIIRAIPYEFSQEFAKKYFINLLEGLDNNNLVKEKYITRACKNAIKSGQTSLDVDIENLIKKIPYTENVFTCPHGRPTIIKISRNEVDKRFGR